MVCTLAGGMFRLQEMVLGFLSVISIAIILFFRYNMILTKQFSPSFSFYKINELLFQNNLYFYIIRKYWFISKHSWCSYKADFDEQFVNIIYLQLNQ